MSKGILFRDGMPKGHRKIPFDSVTACARSIEYARKGKAKKEKA
jgi:hypothetical protein